jgi:phosphatidylserine decarboxylase
MKAFYIFCAKFLSLVPKVFLSRCIGKLTEKQLPNFILNPFIRWFIRHYHVNMEEAIPTQYKTFNEFFGRAIRPECRPVDLSSETIVSPVDAQVGAFGKIENTTLIQAKGVSYSLSNLVLHEPYVSSFSNGDYITLYLSPKDYHRIHSPISASIQEAHHIPGTLYPVNSLGVHYIPGLFCLNERWITLLQHPKIGNIAVIKVGATVVGKIGVVYEQVQAHRKNIWHKEYPSIPIEKGKELGKFLMGSTVILLFEPNKIKLESLALDQKVRMGQIIGTILS